MNDIKNLYKTTPSIPTVGAIVELTWSEFETAIEEVDDDDFKEKKEKYKQLKDKFTGSITIIRNLVTKTYDIEDPDFSSKELNNEVAENIVDELPFILYFDDFRDSISEKIEIKKDTKEKSGWLSIIEKLFKKTDPTFSVFDLPTMEDRQRKSVISRVQTKLNATLTSEWQNFKLEDRDALEISLEYKEATLSNDTTRHFLKIEVIEKDSENNEHYFYILDRSKGFFWFFNFVMKLEFNPKVIETNCDYDAIYLLDEPGSYLHSFAQSKLCSKLKKLSENNKVIYCTHSHYLLNPEIIPINNIKIAEKDGNGNIQIVSIHEFNGDITSKHSPFQPIMDALLIKPFVLDLTHNNVIIVEGICDFYAFDLMKGIRSINILPSKGANSIKTNISLMIAWCINYKVVWDNDTEGR